jgi:hypothetical protein
MRRPQDGLDAAPERVTRRVFVTGAAGAGAAAAVRLAPASSGTGAPAAPDGDPRRLSYRETDHIRWFYARSRF